VIGVTTGGRQAARLFYIVREYESSDSTVRRQSTAIARDVLCSRNSGPRQFAGTSRSSRPDAANVISSECPAIAGTTDVYAVVDEPDNTSTLVSHEAYRTEFDVVSAASE